ncbi:hypothetical protein, partial [Acetobacter tropicalis]|uniref:hypothetical protein n=1 Tax=Acetobacter tropicalis TaxID=104102 RepID=UPI001E489089
DNATLATAFYKIMALSRRSDIFLSSLHPINRFYRSKQTADQHVLDCNPDLGRTTNKPYTS